VSWEPGRDDGTGGTPDPDLPGERDIPPTARRPAFPASPDALAAGGNAAPRDPRLAGFARDEEWDACPPSAALAAALEGASGPDWRCPGASRDEMLGLLRRWAALEAWAAAGRLGVLRALIRDDGQPLPGGGWHGDLPDGWTRSLTYEAAAALAVSVPTAEAMMWLAWDLQARLPGIAALLADGTLGYSKARAVADTFQLLNDEDAATAEALILGELPGKNYGQVKKLAEQAAVTVDPSSAVRRREDAERNKSRVQLSREDSGAAALCGRDLPTDQTLAAHARVCARARQYKDSRAFPSDTRMDQFRAAAYLDLLNNIPAETRIASGQIATVTPTERGARSNPEAETSTTAQGEPTGTEDTTSANATNSRVAGHDDFPSEIAADDGNPDAFGPDDDNPDGGGPADGDPDGRGSDGSDPGGRRLGGDDNPVASRTPSAAPSSPPRLTDLVLPLATLLGLAERPGEGHSLGPLDPNLCRELALAAIDSPWTQLCVTVTNPDGIAIGHGCARSSRKPRTKPVSGAEQANTSPGSNRTPLSLPSQVNLTITAARLAELTATTGPPGQAPWSFTQDDSPGPPDGYGTWTLILPDGRRLTVCLEPVPTFTCDHRRESHAYQPNDALRHLVQVRDADCTFPLCSRHARESDFEHAVPYDKGGRTCACNAGARSRACHQVKQSRGWTVTQPKPGWHQWTTPTGRTYTQAPKHYPT
jgi:hypothetical protein